MVNQAQELEGVLGEAVAGGLEAVATLVEAARVDGGGGARNGGGAKVEEAMGRGEGMRGLQEDYQALPVTASKVGHFSGCVEIPRPLPVTMTTGPSAAKSPTLVQAIVFSCPYSAWPMYFPEQGLASSLHLLPLPPPIIPYSLPSSIPNLPL